MAQDAYPAAGPTVPRPATPVAVAVVTAHPSAVHAAALALAVQTLTLRIGEQINVADVSAPSEHTYVDDPLLLL